MKPLTKTQLVNALCDSMHFKRADLNRMTYDELLEHYNELFEGIDPLFPNGRDYDAEDEDGM